MKAAFIQTRPVFGETGKNVEDALKRIDALDADVAVLPELFSTGYQFRSKKEAAALAEDARMGYVSDRLAEIAADRKMHIAAGMAERVGRKVYNSSILVGPRGFIAVYRKAHLFWDEKKIFDKGDTPFEVHDAGGARVGMMICFDWLFPEAARTLALKGADIILHPSNLVLPHCPQAMITRCLENRVFAVTANRVGTEERIQGRRLRFIGQSQIIAPDGRILCRAGSVRAEAKAVEIDVSEARKKKITPLNDIFRDRRRDMYEL
ncbi:MAG: acyltransferase [Deltaproteobacteria bacterium]|nr:acyltransferase [Deltaproteobacteria bacterium]